MFNHHRLTRANNVLLSYVDVRIVELDNCKQVNLIWQELQNKPVCLSSINCNPRCWCGWKNTIEYLVIKNDKTHPVSFVVFGGVFTSGVLSHIFWFYFGFRSPVTQLYNISMTPFIPSFPLSKII